MRLIFVRVLLFVMLAGALSGVPVLVPRALAQGSARVVFLPSSATVGEGTTTAVEVRIENAQNLYGLDIRVAFDPAVVEVVDADTSKSGIQVRPGSLLSVDFAIRNTVDNSQGTIWYALTQLNPSQPVSGGGAAFIITFKGKSLGATSPLTITYRQLASQAGEAIAATAENGEIRVVGSAEAPPTPTMAPPAAQPTVAMPTPEPTQPQPAATATLRPTSAPATTQPTPEPTLGVLPVPSRGADTPSPTATRVATQAGTAHGTPERTLSPAATAQAAPPTQPVPTATSQAQEPAGNQGGLILRNILAGVAMVLIVAMMGGITWAVVRARKPRT